MDLQSLEALLQKAGLPYEVINQDYNGFWAVGLEGSRSCGGLYFKPAGRKSPIFAKEGLNFEVNLSGKIHAHTICLDWVGNLFNPTKEEEFLIECVPCGSYFLKFLKEARSYRVIVHA